MSEMSKKEKMSNNETNAMDGDLFIYGDNTVLPLITLFHPCIFLNVPFTEVIESSRLSDTQVPLHNDSYHRFTNGSAGIPVSIPRIVVGD